jgi:hypothetical protein
MWYYALELNKAGIWRMFSSVNEVTPVGPHSRPDLRHCPLPYTEYFDALKDVGCVII